MIRFVFWSLPIISALIFYLVFPPINVYPLAFLALAPFFIFLSLEKSFWKLVFGAFIFRFIYGYVLSYYIFDPVLYSQSIFIFLGLPVSIYFLRKADARLTNFFAVGFLYLLFDYWEAQYTLIPSFVVQIGNALGLSPFVGLARWGGLWGLGIFLVLVNVLAGQLILRIVARTSWRSFAVVFLAVIGTGLLVSQLFLKQNNGVYNRGVKEAVFASISTDRSFDSDGLLPEVQLNKIKSRLKDEKFDLIIFPEALFEEEVRDSELESDLRVYRDLARDLGVYLLMNASREGESGRYNTNFLIAPDGTIAGRYDKNDLILGGEYWPKWIENLPASKYKSSYQFGEDATVFSIGGGRNFATPICFEAHLPNRLIDYVNRGANFFVNSSSNKWMEKFSDSGLRRYLGETLSLRRIYSVWLQKPIIINGRRDYAGVILPNGDFDLLDFENDAGYTIYKGRLKLN